LKNGIKKTLKKIFDMNIRESILKHGIENCLFLVPMRPLHNFMGITYSNSTDAEFIVPSRITEHRYKLSDNYKITLCSIYKEYGEESFYLCDLESLIERGTVEFFIKQS